MRTERLDSTCKKNRGRNSSREQPHHNASLANQFFKKGFGGPEIRLLLRSADLPLDRNRVLVTDLLELRDNCREIHSSLPDRCLLTKSLHVCRVQAVLGVHPLQKGPQGFDCI